MTTSASPRRSAKRALRSNVLANLGYFVLSTVIGIWWTPFLIDNLGIAVYGLIPLATQLTSYMAIFTTTFSAATGRFLTADLARGDMESANKTFNTSFLLCLVGAAALLPIAMGAAWFVPSFLEIPAGQTSGIRWLLLATMSAFLLGTVSSSFAESTFARSRFDIRSLIETAALLSVRGALPLVFLVAKPQLWHVAAALFAGAVVRQAGYYMSWRKLTPELGICRSMFDRTRLSRMLGMSGWLTVDQVGALLFLNIDLLVINKMLGPEAGGNYAPALQWLAMLRSLTATASGVLTPTIIACEARGEHEKLTRLSRQSVKLLGLAMALPVGALCGLARPLLEVWINPEFGRFAPLLQLLIATSCISFASAPLFSINVAKNKVRLPGLITLLLGAANLGLAIILTGPVGWGLYGVAAAGAIMRMVKNAIFTPMYAAHVMKQRLGTYFWVQLPGVVGTGVAATIAWLCVECVPLTSWGHLAGAGLLVATVYAPLVFFIALRREERLVVLDIVRGKGYRPPDGTKGEADA